MYVCTSLDQDGVTCLAWTALQQGFFPPLSIQDAAAIGGAAMLVLAVVWAYRQVIKAL